MGSDSAYVREFIGAATTPPGDSPTRSFASVLFLASADTFNIDSEHPTNDGH